MLSSSLHVHLSNRGRKQVVHFSRRLIILSASLVACSLMLATECLATDVAIRGEFKRATSVPRGFEVQAAGSGDLVDLGIKKYQAGDLNGAINYFTQAINRDPQNVQAIMCRAYAREDAGDYLNAMADLAQTRIAPLQPICLNEIGYCHTHLNSFPAALNDFNSSLALASKGASAVTAYARRASVKRTLHDINGAIADCDSALLLDPQDAESHWQRGVTYFSSTQYTKALPDLKFVVQQNPKYADGHLLLAQCFQKLGMRNDALAEYQKANYIYKQMNDDDGVQQTAELIKTLQSRAGA